MGIGLEFAIVQIITSYAYEFIERWMKNLQVLQILPIKKDGKVYTAGLDGSRGIIIGSPTENDAGLVEGTIGRLLAPRTGAYSSVYNFALGLLASPDMLAIASKYRQQNSIPEPGTVSAGEKVIANIMQGAVSEEKKITDAYHAMIIQPRVQKLSTTEGNTAFKRYSVPKSSDITMNPDISEDMVPLFNSTKYNAMKTAGTMQFTHDIQIGSPTDKYFNKAYTFSLNTQKLSCQGIVDKGIIDLPFLRPSAATMFDKIVDTVQTELKNEKLYGKDSLKKHPIVLRSALRVGDPTWRSTGFVFRMTVVDFAGFETQLKNILSAQQSTIEKLDKGASDNKVFTYKAVSGLKNTFDIFVYPPRV
jgi:hypothetical protein